jgi:methylmalonyl-CoA mutase
MYQRGKIQQESMTYEETKHSGERPVIGVNTFTRDEDAEQPEDEQVDLMRSSDDEKQHQLRNLRAFQARNEAAAEEALAELKTVARNGENTFDALMEAVKVCSLGQITHAFFEVGGRYRRNM